jgi:hypothetical protein
VAGAMCLVAALLAISIPKRNKMDAPQPRPVPA